MALPTVVGVGAVSADVNAVTPALPSGVQENDILILFAESWASNAAMTVSGYEAVPGGAIVNNTRLSVFWKRAGSSESAPTTSDTGDHQIAGIMAVRGCVKKGNPFLTSVGGTTAASGTKTATAFNTYIDDVLVINAFAQGEDTYTTGQYSSFTNSSLANLTERFDAFTDLGNGGGFAVSTGEKAAAGTVSATTVTCAITTAGMHWTGALIPEMYDNRPIVRARGSASANTTAVTPGLPVGWQQNDLLLAFVETNDQAVTISGYTEAGSSPASNSGTNPTRLTVFYKWAGASETAPTTSDSGDHNIAQMVAIRGARGSGNPFSVTASNSGGTSASISITGATTTSDNTLVLAAVASTLDGVSSEDVTFSSWANADLDGVIEVLDFANSSGTGGAIGVAAGYKPVAGVYGATTVTQTSAVEYATWTGAVLGAPTLAAESGTLSLASGDAYLGIMGADEGALTLVGADANLSKGFLLSAAEGVLSMAGEPASGLVGFGLAADPGTLSLTQQGVTFGYTMPAVSALMALSSSDVQVLAASPETFSLSFIVDLIPPDAGGTYQRYTERLTVDGAELKVRSWTYDESASSIAGSLQIQLADVSQRSLVTSSSQITFELGEWTGTDWRWTSLLDTGRLRNSQYNISRQGIGPDDSFTFTAMSEMEDLLGTAPDNNEVWYDPLRHEVTSDDVEGIYDLAGNYYPPTIVSISGMTLHGIMQRIFVTECGFADFVTNIPDFRVPMIEFSAGQPYAAALSGVIGMFEPTYTWTGTGASLTISINDGTTGAASGIPSARTVTTSRATSLGVADELDKVRSLIMSVNQQRYSFDYWSERTEATSTDIGNLDLYPGEYVTTQTTTTYRDYFHDSNPDRAVKTEVRRITTESFLGGTELVKETTENFYYDTWGRLYLRSKSVDAKVPNPASSFALSLIPVFEETERLSYRVHPYRPGQYYRSKREVSSAGLVYIDGDNQQLGEDYVRDAVSVYRAGNVTDAMTSDWRKLKTFVERQKPMRNGKVEIKTTEYDYLAKQFTIDELKEEDGQLGVNAFVNEQRRIVVYEPGQTSVTGQTMTVNMGELPLSTATSLAKRLLRRRLYATERVELSIAGIDPTIQRGMTVNPKGRDAVDLGTFTVEARTMNGSPQGYSMSLQARSAATS